jgi:maltose/moltooligosaccharide transporter
MHAPPSERFPVGRTLLLGAMFMGMGMTLPIFNHFVPVFLREMALSATLITFILTWDNYLNMFMQPIVGQLSDRTRTRIGRRKPWVLVGAPIALTAFLFVPSATTAYGIMAAIFFTNFGNALFRSPGVALIGDLYPSHQRSLANGIINLMLGVGAALAYFGGGWLYGQYGRYAPFIFGSGVMALALVIAMLFVHEPQAQLYEADEKEAGLLESIRALLAGVRLLHPVGANANGVPDSRRDAMGVGECELAACAVRHCAATTGGHRHGAVLHGVQPVGGAGTATCGRGG